MPCARGERAITARDPRPLAARLVARRPGRERIDHTHEVRDRFRCAEIVGRSKSLAQVLQQAALVAPLDVDVLITGPSGTGKSAVAHEYPLGATEPVRADVRSISGTNADLIERVAEEHHVFPDAKPGGDTDSEDAPVNFQEATRRFQRRYVLEALERNDWNVAETARQLELARSHLYNLINDLGLKRAGDGRGRR